MSLLHAQRLQDPPHFRVGEVVALSGEPLQQHLIVKYVRAYHVVPLLNVIFSFTDQKNTQSLGIAKHSRLKPNGRFGGKYRLHLQGRRITKQ
jgi:hypothetical protein